DVLDARMAQFGLDPEHYQWYRDFRRYGGVPHAGFGLGFERLVVYVCGLSNIRDAIAYPRAPGHAEFCSMLLFIALCLTGISIRSICAFLIFWPLLLVHLRVNNPALRHPLRRGVLLC